MTPFFDESKEQLITTVTVGALEDLGYEVNYDSADDILDTSSTQSLVAASSNIKFLPEHKLKPSASFSLEGVVGSPEDMPESLRSHLSFSG